MRTVGVVCEYNPFHLGHARQLALLRQQDPEAVVVCLMSGLYVQRGQPAVFSRQVRARAALLAGADLVLELPVDGEPPVRRGLLPPVVWRFWTGWGWRHFLWSRDGRPGDLFGDGPAAPLSPVWEALRPHLDEGLSFPAARSRALKDLGGRPGGAGAAQ